MGITNEKQMFILPIEFNGDAINQYKNKQEITVNDFYINDYEWNSNTLKNRFKRYKFSNCELECQENHIECNIYLLIFDKEICYKNITQGLLEFEVNGSIEKSYFENNFRNFTVLYNGKRYESTFDDKITNFCIEEFLEIEIGNVDFSSLENCIYNFKIFKSDISKNVCTIDSLSIYEKENANMDIYFVMFELLILEKLQLQKLKDRLKGGWDLEKVKKNMKLREFYSIMYKIENSFEKVMFFDVQTKEFNNIKQDFGIYEIKYTCEKNIDRYASMLSIEEKVIGNRLLTIINGITFSLASYELLEILDNYAIRIFVAISVFVLACFCFDAINNKN